MVPELAEQLRAVPTQVSAVIDGHLRRLVRAVLQLDEVEASMALAQARWDEAVARALQSLPAGAQDKSAA